MGASKLKRLHADEMLLSCAGVQTAGGGVRVRREAMTSRPWLMSSVGRGTEHQGFRTRVSLHADRSAQNPFTFNRLRSHLVNPTQHTVGLNI